jgi:hypothetical protein
MNASSIWPRNRLLLALPSRNLKRLMPELEQIRCHRAQVLMHADSALDHVFFPDSGVVSVVAVYADGTVIEMATIGREGFTDVQAVFGAKRSSGQLLVQIPGSAAKMSRAAAANRTTGATMAKRILAICLVFIIGASCGTVLGFIVTVWRSSEASMVPEAFPYWLQDPFGLNWWPWPLFGGTIAALVYLAHLLGRTGPHRQDR